MAYWAVSHSLQQLCNASDPYQVLDFILGPIKELFVTNNRSLIHTLKRLAILAVRFEDTVVNAVSVDWTSPFSTNFSFLEEIENRTSEELAISVTDADYIHFNNLCPQDFLNHSNGRRQQIGRLWQTLSSDIKECVIADRLLGSVVGRVARVSGPQFNQLICRQAYPEPSTYVQ